MVPLKFTIANVHGLKALSHAVPTGPDVPAHVIHSPWPERDSRPMTDDWRE